MSVKYVNGWGDRCAERDGRAAASSCGCFLNRSPALTLDAIGSRHLLAVPGTLGPLGFGDDGAISIMGLLWNAPSGPSRAGVQLKDLRLWI